jgi:hypothetical protein
VTDDRLYKAHSPTKIWLSPEARQWARHYGLSEQEFGKFLLSQHAARAEPYVDEFAGDVADHAPCMPDEGFTPQVLADAASDLDPFRGDVGQSPPGLNEIIEGFRPEPERKRAPADEAYWNTKW